VARREPDLSRFSSWEIALVDDVIRQAWAKTARQMSEESHECLGWQLARFGETIPYGTALIDRDVALSPKSREIARELARRLERGSRG